jgi:tRNA1Val (adenine37-N6)-methyltransferase
MTDTTTDTFFGGSLTVTQPRDGYRFSIDAVILAATLHLKTGQKIVDLGTGCGIIPLILAHRNSQVKIFGIEMQEALVDFARINVDQNRMADRIDILQADIRKLKTEMIEGSADLVVSNPPYRCAGSGRINPNCQRAIARHEIHLNLSQLLKTVRSILRTGGRFVTIYPADRIVDLFCKMHAMGLEPKQMRAIHSRRAQGAKLILAQGVMRGNPGLTIDPPLIIYQSDGNYTQEMQTMIES